MSGRLPLEVAEGRYTMDLDQELAEADRREAEEMKFRAKRRRNKLIGHAIAGAITFGFFAL